MVPLMTGRFLAAALLCLLALTPSASAQSGALRAQAVVELYTSQGCFQCPRANRLVGMLAREERVLALTFPVGIWDYLGWTDTFAHRDFTERQRLYSRTLRVRGRYTPQLVINGATQISASDWDEARGELNHARSRAMASSPDIAVARLRSERVRVTVGAGAARPELDIWLVSYEPGPVTVNITRGVNLDRRISHYNLVRRIDRLGAWTGEAVWFERPRSSCAPRCAVLLQEPNGGPVIAAAYTPVSAR